MDVIKHTTKPTWPPVKPAAKTGTTPPRAPTTKNPNVRVPVSPGPHKK